ncbi:MAG: hypothetical protein ACRD3V_06635 [Vicinamibacteria bacterium]
MARFLSCFLVIVALGLAQSKPDFTGSWRLDTDKSDDGEALILAGSGDPDRMNPKDRQTVERLIALARAFRGLEIRQGESDFRLYDDANNVRIYYIDGKKHLRETPWGEKLETETQWEGSELHMKTDGKDLGEVLEIYAPESGQLVYTVKIRLKDAEEDTVVRSYYRRAQE